MAGMPSMATQGGTMNISDVDMSTSGASSSAIATDAAEAASPSPTNR